MEFGELFWRSLLGRCRQETERGDKFVFSFGRGVRVGPILARGCPEFVTTVVFRATKLICRAST